jgi:hypothetical protein
MPDRVGGQLVKLAEAYGVDELIVLSILPRSGGAAALL